MALSEADAKSLISEAGGGTDLLAAVSQPSTDSESSLPEVQNAIRAARESAGSAILVARLTNRLTKKAEGKATQGVWVASAVDSLRSSLLFASAGLDTSLKRLARHALPTLSTKEEAVGARFKTWAESQVSDPESGAVQAKALIRILLEAGVTPRDSLIAQWIHSLTGGSAQSVDRVNELAQALGVTEKTIRMRFSPDKDSVLKKAFVARNEIAHELDVTNPRAEIRKPLEKIRRYRSESDVTKWCIELLDVTQLITNDVARRLRT